jgi:calcyclin binding protein
MAGLRAQAKELERLIGLAQRETSRQLLQAELARVTEALASATTSDPPPAPRPAPAPAPAPLRLSSAPTTAPIEYSSISSYAWDHSNKFVKVYLTIPGLEKIPDAQIEAVFGERSLVLSVAGVSTPPVNRRLNVPALCHAVREDQCSWVRKPSDMLLIKLRKASDGQEWASLNDSAAKKELQQKERAETNQARTPREFPRHCMHPSRRCIVGLHPRPRALCVAGQVDRGAAAADVRRGGRGGQARALPSVGGRTREARGQ